MLTFRSVLSFRGCTHVSLLKVKLSEVKRGTDQIWKRGTILRMENGTLIVEGKGACAKIKGAFIIGEE